MEASDDFLQPACIDGAMYRQADNLGKVLAHVSLLPYLALFYQATLLYSHRDVHRGLFLLGATINIAIGRLLKQAIRQTRPLSTCEALGICNKPGMPSSHCQVIFFLLGLELLQTCRKARCFPQSSWQRLCQLMMTLLYISASLLVAYSRVYLGYHDLPQVLAGAAAGLLVAATCVAATCLAATHFDALQRSLLGQLFRIKDTWAINDVLLLEYEMALAHKAKKLK